MRKVINVLKRMESTGSNVKESGKVIKNGVGEVGRNEVVVRIVHVLLVGYLRYFSQRIKRYQNLPVLLQLERSWPTLQSRIQEMLNDHLSFLDY